MGTAIAADDSVIVRGQGGNNENHCYFSFICPCVLFAVCFLAGAMLDEGAVRVADRRR